MNKDKIETILNLFEGNEIRSIWDKEKEEYYFSVVDVIKVFTNSNIPKRYWTDLKRKLINEGSEVYEKIVRLKLKAPDGNIKIDVNLENQTVWLFLEQMSKLFGRDKSVISRHIKNIFNEKELDRELVVANFEQLLVIIKFIKLIIIISM